MSWDYRLSDKAVKNLKRFPKHYQKRIFEALEDMKSEDKALNTFQIMDALAECRMELSKELGKDAAKIDDELRAQVEEKIKGSLLGKLEEQGGK